MSMNGRDSRRRRIVERGNDRLALITGRIPTLTSDTGSGGGTETGSETRHSYTSSCPTWISQNHLVSEQSSPGNLLVFTLLCLNCYFIETLLYSRNCF